MGQPDDIKGAIRTWWSTSPMTYGDQHGSTCYMTEDGKRVSVEIGSQRFFDLADQVFYGWNTAQHSASGRFGRIFDYARYAGTRVLEVGCGLGCMAMNWAQHGAQMTAVDLNPVAVAQTRRRFELFGLTGDIREADAENLPFADGEFDYVYSWGVLHHTPRTKQAISELYRVLKPGGKGGVMLYHRNSMYHRFQTQYVEGFMNMESTFLSPLELGSRYADGDRAEGNPHTWPVTKSEVGKSLFADFRNVQIKVLGTELRWIFDHWYPNLGSRMPKRLMAACVRRWGWSLWITGDKSN